MDVKIYIFVFQKKIWCPQLLGRVGQSSKMLRSVIQDCSTQWLMYRSNRLDNLVTLCNVYNIYI